MNNLYVDDVVVVVDGKSSFRGNYGTVIGFVDNGQVLVRFVHEQGINDIVFSPKDLLQVGVARPLYEMEERTDE